MGYTAAQVEEIAGKLRALPAIESPPKDLTKQEVVKMLAKEIKALQKRGYSLEQIANSLKGEGLDISTPTLKSYMQKSKATTKPKAASQKKVVAVAESTGAGSSESDGNAATTATNVDERRVDDQAENIPEARKTSYSNKSKLVPKPDTPDL